MKTDKEKLKINKLKANIQIKHPDHVLEAIKDRARKLTNWITVLSVAGPLLLTVLCVLFPWDKQWASYWNNIIIIVLTIIIILGLFILVRKSSLYSKAVSTIETSKEQQYQQISQLRKKVEILSKTKSYYAVTASEIGKAIKAGDTDLSSLSVVTVASLHEILTSFVHGDNITFNLYELRNSQLRMLLTYNNSKYSVSKEELDNPILLNYADGLDIRSQEIQDYYCVKCLRGKVRDRDGKFVLPDWISIVKEFHWKKWEEGEKEDIIQSKDRERCLNAGFRYNQYIGIKWRYSPEISKFLEVIANDDTTFDDVEDIQYVARIIKDTFFPINSVIWDIFQAN